MKDEELEAIRGRVKRIEVIGDNYKATSEVDRRELLRDNDELRAELAALRDKLREVAGNCDYCDGFGHQQDVNGIGQKGDCPECADLRRLLADQPTVSNK